MQCDTGLHLITPLSDLIQKNTLPHGNVHKNTVILSFPTLALPRSGAVEAYTSSQTVHRLPYAPIITKRLAKVKSDSSNRRMMGILFWFSLSCQLLLHDKTLDFRNFEAKEGRLLLIRWIIRITHSKILFSFFRQRIVKTNPTTYRDWEDRKSVV